MPPDANMGPNSKIQRGGEPFAEEARAQLLLASIRDHAIVALDSAGIIQSWNPGAERLTGYRAEEAIGQHLSIFSTPEDRVSGKCAHDLEAAEQNEHVQVEGWRVRKDGGRFWASVVLAPIRDAEGRWVGFSSVIHDLTERRASELRLRESEERLRLLIASVRDYAIFMLDPEGTVVTWNPGAERIKGYRPEEIIGKHLSTFYLEADRQRAHPQRLLQLAAEQGRVEEEGWRVRKDGGRFWADVVISAIRGPEGALIGFSKVTRDLSDRRQAEEELRQSEQRLRLLLESVRDYAIYMLDPQGKVITWNPGAERVKGYSTREILGRHCSIFYTEEDLREGTCERDLQRAAAEGRFEDEGWRVRKDGTRFWASVVISSVRDAAGTLVGFSKVTRDLTERRIAEEERLRLLQAQEALRLRDEFLSIAAHELRTPLTALQIGLQSLSERTPGLEPRLARRITRATHSAERLSQLVESLLDVARISTGRFELHPTPFDLAEVAREVAERLQDTAAQAHCEVVTELDGPIPGAWDRLRVEQIVMNLLSNAFKYASGTEVRLAVRRDQGGALIEIEDRGPGIAEADLERIFGRFERASSLHHYGGLGLGLYVSQELVNAHGGTIRAQNLPQGGIRFTVRLPMESRAPERSGADLH